jgi:hypothetical protein
VNSGNGSEFVTPLDYTGFDRIAADERLQVGAPYGIVFRLIQRRVRLDCSINGRPRERRIKLQGRAFDDERIAFFPVMILIAIPQQSGSSVEVEIMTNVELGTRAKPGVICLTRLIQR